jgi:S1-C subfamily serine protease
MDEFFGVPRNRRSPPPVQKKEFRQQSLGSGVIVSKMAIFSPIIMLWREQMKSK